MSVRVLIVDDQALVRTGLRMILDAEAGIEVVDEAADGLDGVRLARRHQPDVVLMDVRMPNMDGIEATRVLLAAPGCRSRVLVLTTFDQDEHIHDALRAGASGFLLKDSPAEDLAAAIHIVAAGEALLSPSVTRRVIEEFIRQPERAQASPKGLTDLTVRELEVLTLVARGLSNSEISAELVVSEATVKTHVAHMLGKLGLRDRVQAVVLAYEAGVVHPGGTASPLL